MPRDPNCKNNRPRQPVSVKHNLSPWNWHLVPIVLSACASLGANRANETSSLVSRMRPQGYVAEEKAETLREENMFRGLKWRNIGPFRGGRSVAVSGDPHNSNVYYMGGTGGGVWKTDDAGAHWKNVSDGFFKTGSVGAIGVAPSSSNIIYVGMGEHAVRGVMSSYGDGVYKSVDGGVSWQHLGLKKTRHISDVIVHPHLPDVVYVAAQGAAYGPSSERGVYKSIDGGKSWKRILYVNKKTGASSLTMDPNNPEVLYAGMWEHSRLPWRLQSGPGSSIYKSSDGGKSWKKLSKDLPKQMGKIGLSVSGAQSNRVYANIEAAEDKGGVYRSDDGGKSWKHVHKERVVQTRSWYYMEIFADPKDADTVYVLNAPMLKSVDGGNSFHRIRGPHGDHHDLWINPNNPQNMINANDGGATITFNGGATWSTQANQPTAQFYRVSVDDRFPYAVYGGQQDNSAIAVRSRSGDHSIGQRDWYSVGGCETAYLGFDAKDPRFVLGGCYQGGISVYDHETGESKEVQAYPADPFGKLGRDRKYRFNWNAPLRVSPHDPKVFYHAAQVLLRSQDRGQSWLPISPDLTRNDPKKQGPGAGPITNEAAGGENYNTIMYAVESPHVVGEIWVGSDDGLVHLSRDHGKSWKNVTPKAIKNGIVNAIEVSPHDPATAFIAVMRYKLDDERPYIFRTTNYGKSWTPLARTLPKGAYVRVVRQDRKVPRILYAGTELGLFVSFDGGKKWKQYEGNLPVVPITDLAIHNNDLIAATAGRAFWILDDLGAIQQSRGRKVKKLALYQPKVSVRFGPDFGGRFGGDDGSPKTAGTNLPAGMNIDYFLPNKLEESQNLILEVLDAQGRKIRQFQSQKDKDFKKYEGGPSPSPLLPTEAGINRFRWDIRRANLAHEPNVFIMGSYRGSRVAPGEYQIRIRLGDDVAETSGKVIADPRLQVSAEAFVEQAKLIEEVEAGHNQVIASLHQARLIKEQLELHQKLLHPNSKQLPSANQAVEKVPNQKIVDLGKELLGKLEKWELQIVHPKQKTWQDVINFPNQLASQFIYLKEQLDTHDPRPTQGVRDRWKDLRAEWAKRQASLQKLVRQDVAAYNAAFSEHRLSPVVVPEDFLAGDSAKVSTTSAATSAVSSH